MYDAAGRVSQFKTGATVLTSYTYTAATSTIATRTDGSQGATAFTYDRARRQTVINPDDAYVAGTVTRTYRLDGLLATQAFPSSITETLAYDAAKRPTSISLGSAGSISQAFDRAGRVTSDGRSLTGISGDAGTNTQTFAYDALSRLTGSTGLAVSRSYQYDLDGNRTQKVEGAVTTTYTYDRADQVANQVIGATTRTFDYDRYGNLLTSADNTSAVTAYSYDEASRLTTISPPGGGATQVTFTLDALDRQATRLVNGITTDTYQYLDATETAWQTGTGTTTSALLDAEGTRLAVKTGSTVSWLLFDLHGSVVALCPSTGSTLSDAYRFDGWGQQIASSGTAANPWRYRGLLNIGSGWDTGALLDMGARDYSPQLGVFTQVDSVQGSAANPMSMNRFLYALANPATLIDPDGHRPCMEDDGGRCVDSPEANVVYAENQAAARDTGGGVGPDGLSCSPNCTNDPTDYWNYGTNGNPFGLPAYGSPGWCAGVVNFQAICIEDAGTGPDAVVVILIGASLILLCVVVCVPIATGLGLAAGSGSIGAAATAFCSAACPATLEIITFTCGMAGACFGPEVPGAGLAGSARNVNPLRGTTNCVNCVIALDSVLMDANAVALKGGVTGIDQLATQFGSTWLRATGEADVVAYLQNAGPGSRGIVFGSRGADPGHVWNAINQGGSIRFLDGQTGTIADWTANFNGFAFLPIPSTYTGMFEIQIPSTWTGK